MADGEVARTTKRPPSQQQPNNKNVKTAPKSGSITFYKLYSISGVSKCAGQPAVGRVLLFKVCARCAYKISAIQSMNRATAVVNYYCISVLSCIDTKAHCSDVMHLVFTVPTKQHRHRRQHRPVAIYSTSIYKIVIFFLLFRAHNLHCLYAQHQQYPAVAPRAPCPSPIANSCLDTER